MRVICIALLFGSALPACKKSGGSNNGNPGNNFSDSIRSIIPQPIIDSLRKWGLDINDGKTPPAIAGIYLLSPDSCEFDNSGYNTAGEIYDDYKIRFSQQDNTQLSIRVDRKDVGSDSDYASDSVATFISGNGNYFTVFAQEKGVESGVAYTSLGIYSGQITSSGIVGFQLAHYLKSKDPDPGNVLISVGSTRIFTNAGGPAVPVGTFGIDPVMHQRSFRMHAIGSSATQAKF